MTLDAELADWRDIAGLHPWKGVLLGNGASMVVWPKFGYRTLFQVACDLPDHVALSETDRQLFQNLHAGANFEQVLHDLAVCLRVADAIGGALKEESEAVQECYTHIRTALIAAVHAVHVRYHRVSDSTLQRIGAYLAEQGYVFSTNYDLIVYWSMMRDADRFTDCFRDREFERSFADLRRTKVLYLHGALHLYHTLRSGPRKNRNEDGADLLERFGQPIEGEDIFPIFVSEGDADQKMQAIEDSPYLSFAYEQLDAFTGPLVVFGNHLGPQDQHLVDAIVQRPLRPIAISIRPGDEVRVRRDKAHYAEVLSNVRELRFFDSTTHPLGDPQAFVWGGPMSSDEIAAQLAPTKTIVLPCEACAEDALVLGRSPLCWSCGHRVRPRQRFREYVRHCLEANTYGVEGGDASRPPYRCDACGEMNLINVGLKRREIGNDTFHCFNCDDTWPPSALASCPQCGNFYDARVGGVRGCSLCFPSES